MKKRVISLVRLHGGVGQSTVAADLAHEFARLGYRVLAVDLCPIGTLTSSVFCDRVDGPSSYQALAEGVPLESLATFSPEFGIDLVPVGRRFDQLTQEIDKIKGVGEFLAKRLSISLHDIALFDVARHREELRRAALLASTDLLLTTLPDGRAVTAGIRKFIEDARALNPNIAIRILVNKYSRGQRGCADRLAELRATHPEMMTRVVRNDSGFDLAYINKKPLRAVRPNSVAVTDLEFVALEMLGTKVSRSPETRRDRIIHVSQYVELGKRGRRGASERARCHA